ncbi:MAG: type III-B CRISPR module RAMP protein Cmr4 [Pseudomonadota bacterium]
MSKAFLWLRAETFIHVGVGQQSSLIDLPFAREGATGYPYIPGSGLKGALRDAGRLAYGWQGGDDPADVTAQFGEQNNAGRILVSDARLAFLPVRSMDRSYRYVTCCALLNRLARDLEFAGCGTSGWTGDRAGLVNGKYLSSTAGAEVFLEEFPFHYHDAVVISALIARLPTDIQTQINDRTLVISDDDFAYFAQYGLHVRTRNRLDPKTKTVDGSGLWTEESLPPDALMYAVLTPRLPSHSADLVTALGKFASELGNYFQVGGNETVGEGWFKILPEPGAPAPGGP